MYNVGRIFNRITRGWNDFWSSILIFMHLCFHDIFLQFSYYFMNAINLFSIWIWIFEFVISNSKNQLAISCKNFKYRWINIRTRLQKIFPHIVGMHFCTQNKNKIHQTINPLQELHFFKTKHEIFFVHLFKYFETFVNYFFIKNQIFFRFYLGIIININVALWEIKVYLNCF